MNWLRNNVNANVVIGTVIMLLAIYTVVATSISNNRQEVAVREQAVCNEEFIRVIRERSQITASDGENLARLITDIGDVIRVPDEGSNERLGAAFQRYQEQALANQAERAKNPYPDPRCET